MYYNDILILFQCFQLGEEEEGGGLGDEEEEDGILDGYAEGATECIEGVVDMEADEQDFRETVTAQQTSLTFFGIFNALYLVLD